MVNPIIEAGCMVLFGFGEVISQGHGSSFVEGQNVTVEYRWAHGQYDRLPELAADLASRQIAVIANSYRAIRGEHCAGRLLDDFKEGLVASLNRPGGNATAAVAKRMQLLKEVVPRRLPSLVFS
jgi:hypothetical protein